MNRRLQPVYTPPPTARDTDILKGCKRSCCWSPYGHVTRTGCTCHAPADGGAS